MQSVITTLEVKIRALLITIGVLSDEMEHYKHRARHFSDREDYLMKENTRLKNRIKKISITNK